ncbi:MAG TPA: hypothetical protein DD376_00370 [Sutterella sp.]|nr:hypothetical protein [Sutterella sp.]
MPTTALILVLIAAFLHATWNYQLKKACPSKVFWPVSYLMTLTLCVPILLIYDPTIFSGITKTGWLVICLSAPIHIVYAYVLQYGYKQADYSIVYPTARGTGPLITVLAAVIVLGDRPSPLGICAIVSILIGIILLAGKTHTAQTVDKKIGKGLFWGTLTGVCIAGYSFCDAWAVQQHTGLTPLSFYFPALAVRCLILWPIILMTDNWRTELRDMIQNRVDRKALFCTSIGSPGAYILVLFALTLAPLSYVAPGREIGMMIGVIIGALLLKESLTVKRISGVALMVLGVVLIGLAK